MVILTHLLKLEDEPQGGVEVMIFLGDGDEGFVASEASFCGPAEESLQEVESHFLIRVTIRGSQLIQHPKKMVDFVGVLFRDGSSTLLKKGGGPFSCGSSGGSSSSSGRRVFR